MQKQINNRKTSSSFRQSSGTSPLQVKLYRIIFEAETPSGKAFDILLLLAIALSVIVVMLESVAEIRSEYGALLYTAEWVFTGLFTVEYATRLYCVRKRSHYVFSFFGIIDLLSIIPTYVSLFVIGSQYLLVIRILRLLRVFRVLKMTRFLGEAETLRTALNASIYKITIFIGTVLSVTVIIASIMHLVEGPESGFTSIPRSMYWAIVTLTTVGYGDIAPTTVLGQALAALVMMLGYGVIAVPTGIVSAEMVRATSQNEQSRCSVCTQNKNDDDALFCKGCGKRLPTAPQ